MSDDRPPPPSSGWYRDPTGQGDARYWDGRSWTDAVSRQGTTFQIPMQEAQRGVPPVPGTEFRAAPPPMAAPPSVQVTQTAPGGRSPLPAIVGVLVAVALIVLVVVLAVSLNSDDGDDQEDTTEQEVTGEQPEPVPQTDPPVDESTSGG